MRSFSTIVIEKIGLLKLKNPKSDLVLFSIPLNTPILTKEPSFTHFISIKTPHLWSQTYNHFRNLAKNEAPAIASTSFLSQEERMYYRASCPQLMNRSYETQFMRVQRGHQVGEESYNDDVYEGRPLNHGRKLELKMRMVEFLDDHYFHEQVIHEINFFKALEK